MLELDVGQKWQVAAPARIGGPPWAAEAKPRLLIALPGLNYADVTSHVIPLRNWARALKVHFDVTLLFRSFVEAPPVDLDCRAILPAPDHPTDLQGSARTFWLGEGLRSELRYLTRVKRLAAELAPQFDLVLEKQWRYMGLLATAGHRAGVPSGFLSEGEFYLTAPDQGLTLKRRLGLVLRRALMRHLRHRGVAKSDFLICETAELAAMMARRHGAEVAEKSVVVPPGLDPKIFFPRERAACRATLGLAPDKTVLVYLGALNGSIQCPSEVLEGLARAGRKDIALHILGAGDNRMALETRARTLGLDATFHGYKPQAEASLFIGAADLCLAPYRPSLYQNGNFTSGSCKVVEYLASGRMVVTIPTPRMEFITQGGRYGYHVENEAKAYAGFFRNLPSLAVRRAKEAALLADLAARGPFRTGRLLSWSDNARRYRDALLPFLTSPAPPAPLGRLPLRSH